MSNFNTDEYLPRGGAVLGKNQIIASLDLGTSKTCCIIGEITSTGDIDIIGYGITPASGIKKGMVINIDSVVENICESVAQAEEMAGQKINSVTVGISGENISILNNKGVVAIPRADKEITQQDVDRVMQAATIMALPYDREIIDVIPREFIVDNCDSIKDPVGMVGTRLEVSACIITGLLTVIQNIARCIQKAGLNIDNMILKPLASSEILLSKDEIEMGVILADIGAGITEIAVFQEGCITDYDMIPIGGDFITNDIAIGFRIPFSQAEGIKRRYSCAIASMASEKPDIEIQCIGETIIKKISQKDLSLIIEPRVQEIISLIFNGIRKLNLKTLPPAGLVVTGGGLLNIKGSDEIVKKYINLPVRFGINSTYDKEQAFTVAMGLLHYSLKHKRNDNKRGMGRERAANTLLERAKRLLQDYF